MQTSPRISPPTPAGVIAVVLAYAAFAALWILVSDRVMGLLVSDPEQLVRASTVKGWFFVAVTSLLLYALVHRFARSLVESHRRELDLERERQRPPPMLVAIADASPDAIFAKDEQGRYLLFNNAAARNVGQAPEQVVGHDDRALFPPAQAEVLMAIDRRVRETGQTEIGEIVLQTPDGERVFLETKGPLRGADGRIFGTYGIARDITARKREEAELRRMAEDLDATLQAIPDLLFEVDADGHYLETRAWNESLLAAPARDLPGRTVSEVLPPEAAATVMQALEAAARTGTDYGRTIRLDLGSGTRHFELSVARKAGTPGQPGRFVILSRDITGRMVAETELRRRNDELERFNRAAIDRELRMVALKREVNAMARAAGRPPPYDTTFADLPGTPVAS